MQDVPEISCQVTFLSTDEGGRTQPVNLSGGTYRPHLVVGNPDQRHAIYRDGNIGTEHYLGVQFKTTDIICEPGEPYVVDLQLMYYPRVDYSSLIVDAEFTIREGGRVVGFGRVMKSPLTTGCS